MIINKLELYNFRQYVGYQSVDFSTDKDKNVTVLIGINTSGKTTIVRAFEWCLYGKNGFDDPVLLNSNVRSNMNTGDKQETWVAVTFTHDKLIYTIKRSFRYTCIEHRTIGGDVEVKLKKNPEENLTLEYLQNDGQTKTPIYRSDITESMDRVLPQDLSDYFFFGGERISGIANRTDLSKAVRGLMRLDVLENAREHLSKVIKSFQASIDTSGDESAEKAHDAIETYTQQLHVFEEDRENAKKQIFQGCCLAMFFSRKMTAVFAKKELSSDDYDPSTIRYISPISPMLQMRRISLRRMRQICLICLFHFRLARFLSVSAGA